jgi:hypothetical protein
MLESLKLDSFSGFLNDTFSVHRDAGETLDLVLVEAKDLGSNPRQERFSLLFHGPLDVALEQRIYKIEHARLGPFELFIVPVGVTKSGRDYEAIFNRVL